MSVLLGANTTENNRANLRSAIGNNETSILAYLKDGRVLRDTSHFDEYERYVTGVLGKDKSDVGEFNIDDRILTRYIFIEARNARVHTAAIRNALFYAARNMQKDGREALVGKMLNDNIAGVLGFLTKGVSKDQVIARDIAIANEVLSKYGRSIASAQELADLLKNKEQITEINDKKDLNILKEISEDLAKPEALSHMGGTANPMLPILLDSVFRTKNWADRYLSNIENIMSQADAADRNFSGFVGDAMIPYQTYITPADQDNRHAFWKFIDIFGMFKFLSNRLQLAVNTKAAVSYFMAASFVPLGIALGFVLFFTAAIPAALAITIGAAVVFIGGILLPLLFYNVIAPFINDRLQKNARTQYFGEPEDFRGNDNITEQESKQKKELRSRWALVTVVNTISMSLTIGIAVAAIKWIVTLGGLKVLVFSAGILTSYVAPIIFLLLVISLIPHFANIIKNNNIKKAEAKAKAENLSKEDTEKLISKAQETTSKDKWQSVLFAFGATAAVAGIILLLSFLTTVAPVIGAIAVASLFLPIFFMLPKLSIFSVWKIFEWRAARKEFDHKKLSETGKTWNEFYNAFQEGFGAREILITAQNIEDYFKNNELYQNFRNKMYPHYPESQEMDVIKFFVEDWNNMMKDMYEKSNVISKEESENYSFIIKNGEVITPDLSNAPKDFESRERFYGILKNWRALNVNALPFDELPPMSIRIPAYNEAVWQTLDVEAMPSEKLNSDEVSPDGSRLFGYLAGQFEDQFRILAEKLTPYAKRDNSGKENYYGIDMFGNEFKYTADDWNAYNALLSMFENRDPVNGKIMRGKQLKLADGRDLPQSQVKDEIEIWANKRLQPLSKTIIEYSTLIDRYFDMARRAHPEYSEAAIRNAVKSKLQFVFGYQDFWNLYKDNPNDPRVLGVIKILEAMKERGYGDLFTVPIMRVADSYSYDKNINKSVKKEEAGGYELLKAKQRLRMASSFELQIIEEIEAVLNSKGIDINDQEAVKKAMKDGIDVPAVTEIMLEEVDFYAWVKLNDKKAVEANSTGNASEFLTDTETLRLRNINNKLAQETVKYNNWLEMLNAGEISADSEEGRLAQEWSKLDTKGKRAYFIFSNMPGKKMTIFNLAADSTSITKIKGVFVGSYGKVEHLSLLNTFIEADRAILTADMNMGAYVEQMLTLPNLLTIYKESPAAFVISFPELIGTRNFGTTISASAAHADRTFNYVGQLAMIMRMYYGHPSIIDGKQVETKADMGLMVSEDMMGMVLQFVKQGFIAEGKELTELKEMLAQEKGKSAEQIDADIKDMFIEIIANSMPADYLNQFEGNNNIEKAAKLYEAIGKNPNSKDLQKMIDEFTIAGGMSYYVMGQEVNKQREVHIMNATAMFEKFSSGSSQSFLSYEYTMFNKNHSFLQQLTHFVAGPGFYEKDRGATKFVKYVIYVIVFLGISPFSAAPLGMALTLGLFGVLMSQTSAMTGLLKSKNTYGENLFTWLKGLVVQAPYHMSNMFTHDAGFTKGLAKAAYIATGRTARLAYSYFFGDDASDSSEKAVYNQLAGSHIDTNIRSAIVALIGIHLIRSATLLVSAPYLIIPFAVIGAFLFYNYGGSVTNADIGVVFNNYKKEAARWFNLIKNNGMRTNADGSVVKTASANPVMAFIAGLLVFPYVTAFNAFAFLFSKKSNNTQKRIAGTIGGLSIIGGIGFAVYAVMALGFAVPVVTLIVAGVIGIGFAIAKIVTDSRTGVDTQTSGFKKFAGVVVSGTVFASIMLWFAGAPIGVLLIAIGALALFFGTRGGMENPVAETESKLKEYGYPVTPLTKTVPAVDIDSYATILENVTGNIPEEFLKVKLGVLSQIVRMAKMSKIEELKRNNVSDVNINNVSITIAEVENMTEKRYKDMMDNLKSNNIEVTGYFDIKDFLSVDTDPNIETLTKIIEDKAKLKKANILDVKEIKVVNIKKNFDDTQETYRKNLRNALITLGVSFGIIAATIALPIAGIIGLVVAVIFGGIVIARKVIADKKAKATAPQAEEAVEPEAQVVDREAIINRVFNITSSELKDKGESIVEYSEVSADIMSEVVNRLQAEFRGRVDVEASGDRRQFILELGFEKSVSDLRSKVSAYNANKTKENFAAAEKALEAIEFDVKNETSETLEAQVAEVGTIIEQMYGVSHAEQVQQTSMTQEYIRGIKEGRSADVESFLADENIDGEIVMRNYPGLVTKLSDIDPKFGNPEYLKDISVAFNLGLAGIGESLDRVEFLKAWYVLQVKQGEAKTAAEKEAISKAVETGEFLKAEWYQSEYAKLINDKAMQKKYGLDITTEDNPRFKTVAGDPQLKTKALDIGLRVRDIEGYWTIKSVAEIILDDFIAKKNAGYAGLTLNLLTNAESMKDVKALLETKAYTGKTYGEELVNLGVLKSVYGEDYKGFENTSGVYLQNTHPTLQYNKATGKANFFGFQQLINHGSFFANLFRQVAESKGDQDSYWFFGNTDNYEAGQVPSKLLGWMAETRTPAVIVVTEKGTSEGNKKGGIPTIVGTATNALGVAVPIYKIVEIAQVKGNELLENKFQEAKSAFFNTNMIAVGKLEVLAAIAKLEAALDDERVLEAIRNAYPLKNLDSKEKILDYLYVLGDVIINNKKTSDGKDYVKLEIAISSSLMELNNLISLATGDTLLKLVLLNDEEAEGMFGPIKNLTNFNETFENTKIVMNADGSQTRVKATEEVAPKAEVKAAAVKEKESKPVVSAQEKKAAREAAEEFLSGKNIAVNSTTMGLYNKYGRAAIEKAVSSFMNKLNKENVDTIENNNELTAKIVKMYLENTASANAKIDGIISKLEKNNLPVTIDNIIETPSIAIPKIISKFLKTAITDQITGVWSAFVSSNIFAQKPGASVYNLVHFVAGKDAAAQSNMLMENGILAPRLEYINSNDRKDLKDKKHSAAKRLAPNTMVPVTVEGVTHYLKVEHYVSVDSNGNIVIQKFVPRNAALEKKLKVENISNFYERVAELSNKYFAHDIANNEKQLQASLGVSGMGVIINMDGVEYNRDIKIGNATIVASQDRGIEEVSSERAKQYIAQEGGIVAAMPEILVGRAATEEQAAGFQNAGFSFAASQPISSSLLGDSARLSRFMGNERRRNVSIVKASVVSNGIVNEEAVRNLLASDAETVKIAELTIADLANSEEAVIRQLFNLGFSGVYLNADGITDYNSVKRVLGIINRLSENMVASPYNYVSLDNTVSLADIKDIVGKNNITPVLNVSETAKINGLADNVAVNLDSFVSGNELKGIGDSIVTAFVRDTETIRNNKVQNRKAGSFRKGSYKAAYESAAKSKYLVEINADGLREVNTDYKKNLISVMSEPVDEKANIGEQFNAMVAVLGTALAKSGVQKDTSVLYQLVLKQQQLGTADSYEMARAQIRAYIENGYERLLIQATNTGLDKVENYYSRVDVNVRNQIKALMFNMAINGDNLTQDSMKDMLPKLRNLLASGADLRSLTQLSQDADIIRLIGDIANNPFSESKDEAVKAKVREAFIILVDSSVLPKWIGKEFVRNAKNSAAISLSMTRAILAAA